MRRGVAPLVALAVLAGCGGGDADEPGPADFRRQATAICRDGDRAIDAVKRPARRTNDAIVGYFERLLRANRRSTERFERLDPPAALRDAHDDALDANRAGIAEVRRVIAELRAGGDAREVLTGAGDRLRELSRRADDAARRLGVPACAEE